MRASKSLFIAVSFLLWFPFASLQADEDQDFIMMDASDVADILIEEARQHLGAPYIYGAEGPRSFDCSGFTKYVYHRMGYSLPRSSVDQSMIGRAVEGHLYELQKGDLLFFSSRANSGGPVRHVGIFIATDSTGLDGMFIHASRHGVVLSRLSESYYQKRFLSARRILPDFVCAAESADSADVAAVHTEVRVDDSMDTLQLSSSDRRIILLSDGTWLQGDSTGVYRTSTDEGMITLMKNGRWKYTEPSVIKVPSTAKSVPTVTPVENAHPSTGEQSSEASPEYYTIQRGDSLSKIASRHHTTVAALCRLNGITENTIIRYGYKLRIR